MCEVASFKNFENNLTTVKVMTKTKVAPFYLGHGVYIFTKHIRNLNTVCFCRFSYMRNPMPCSILR